MWGCVLSYGEQTFAPSWVRRMCCSLVGRNGPSPQAESPLGNQYFGGSHPEAPVSCARGCPLPQCPDLGTVHSTSPGGRLPRRSRPRPHSLSPPAEGRTPLPCCQQSLSGVTLGSWLSFNHSQLVITFSQTLEFADSQQFRHPHSCYVPPVSRSPGTHSHPLDPSASISPQPGAALAGSPHNRLLPSTRGALPRGPPAASDGVLFARRVTDNSALDTEGC